jgi:hypothetical protein
MHACTHALTGDHRTRASVLHVHLAKRCVRWTLNSTRSASDAKPSDAPMHRATLSHIVGRRSSIQRCQVLLKLRCHTRSLASKPPTCPSHMQSVRQAKPYLDLLHLGHMTPCHISYAMSFSIITYSPMD